MSAANLIKTVRETIREHRLLESGDCVIVGVSGGIDSMALLHALVALNRTDNLRLDLHVAHLNHTLRDEESDEDAAFVEAAADGLGLPRTIQTRDIKKLCGEEKGSVEEVARRERYRFFERVAVAERADAVAVGHHADDNAETIFQRIVRGTGLRGVCGIPVRRPIRTSASVALIRPMLFLRQGRIREYVLDEGIAYREDASNALLDSTRNVLRHKVLPLIARQINPQVADALCRLGEQANWVERYLRDTASRTLETLVIGRNDQELTLNAAALARKSRIVQTELIREAILLFQLGEQHLGFGHIKGVVELVASGQTGKSLSLPSGMTATLVYDRLVLSAPTDQPREHVAPQVAVHLPGVTRLAMRQMQIECEVVDAAAGDLLERARASISLEEWLDMDSVHPPLLVRNRKEGDRFWPLGAPGSKSVADFLSDAKVSPDRREDVVLLCDQLGPIWLVGHRIDQRVRLTRRTRRALYVRVTNL